MLIVRRHYKASLFQQKQVLADLSISRLTNKKTMRDIKIVAEGDSWFSYPFAKDIVDHLIGMGYAISRHGKAGDTLENMVYGTRHDIKRNTARNFGPENLKEVVETVAYRKPQFVLFSAGGNDIVGAEFEQFLNHSSAQKSSAGLPLFRKQAFLEKVNTSMRVAVEYFLKAIWTIDDSIHILMDGYDYAKPNGTNYSLGGIGLTGPWLLKGFARKGILHREEQEPIIKDMIDGYNEMLATLASLHERFHHIDLRGKFPDESEWDNEIHLKNAGFKKVAELYHVRMAEILGGNPFG